MTTPSEPSVPVVNPNEIRGYASGYNFPRPFDSASGQASPTKAQQRRSAALKAATEPPKLPGIIPSCDSGPSSVCVQSRTPPIICLIHGHNWLPATGPPSQRSGTAVPKDGARALQSSYVAPISPRPYTPSFETLMEASRQREASLYLTKASLSNNRVHSDAMYGNEPRTARMPVLQGLGQAPQPIRRDEEASLGPLTRPGTMANPTTAPLNRSRVLAAPKVDKPGGASQRGGRDNTSSTMWQTEGEVNTPLASGQTMPKQTPVPVHGRPGPYAANATRVIAATHSFPRLGEQKITEPQTHTATSTPSSGFRSINGTTACEIVHGAQLATNSSAQAPSKSALDMGIFQSKSAVNGAAQRSGATVSALNGAAPRPIPRIKNSQTAHNIGDRFTGSTFVKAEDEDDTDSDSRPTANRACGVSINRVNDRLIARPDSKASPAQSLRYVLSTPNLSRSAAENSLGAQPMQSHATAARTPIMPGFSSGVSTNPQPPSHNQYRAASKPQLALASNISGTRRSNHVSLRMNNGAAAVSSKRKIDSISKEPSGEEARLSTTPVLQPVLSSWSDKTRAVFSTLSKTGTQQDATRNTTSERQTAGISFAEKATSSFKSTPGSSRQNGAKTRQSTSAAVLRRPDSENTPSKKGPHVILGTPLPRSPLHPGLIQAFAMPTASAEPQTAQKGMTIPTENLILISSDNESDEVKTSDGIPTLAAEPAPQPSPRRNPKRAKPSRGALTALDNERPTPPTVRPPNTAASREEASRTAKLLHSPHSDIHMEDASIAVDVMSIPGEANPAAEAAGGAAESPDDSSSDQFRSAEASVTDAASIDATSVEETSASARRRSRDSGRTDSSHEPSFGHAFDQTSFDKAIFGQCQSLDSGIAPQGRDSRLYLANIDPRIHWTRDKSAAWLDKKTTEIKKRGGRRQNRGKAPERMRVQRQTLEARAKEKAEAARRGRPPPRYDVVALGAGKSLDFGDVPEDELPELVKSNPAWVRACAWMRENRVAWVKEHREAELLERRGKDWRTLTKLGKSSER